MMLKISVETPFCERISTERVKNRTILSTKLTFVLLTKEQKILHGFFLMAVILIPEQTDRSFLLVRLRERTIAARALVFQAGQLAQVFSKTANIFIFQ